MREIVEINLKSEASWLKKTIFLLLSLSIPTLYHFGYYELSAYFYMFYLAFVFYEADHYNIRFIVGLLVLDSILHYLIPDFFLLFTRVIISIDDFTIELVGIYLISAIIAFAMCVMFFLRGRLVSTFNKLGQGKKKYHLIGTDFLIVISFVLYFCIHVVFLAVTYDSMIEVTDFQSYMDWFTKKENQLAINTFNYTFWVIGVYTLFAIQSYNYKKCRRVWFMES